MSACTHFRTNSRQSNSVAVKAQELFSYLYSMVINKDPQKKSSNGEETPQEAKKRELLATGRFEEGDQGELIRKKTIREQLPVGLPSKERIRELETLNRPMTEVEAREYALASFDPSSNMNIMFSLAAGAGFDPVGDAAMKVLKGGYNVLKGGVGTAKKAIGKGVNILKEVGSGSPSTGAKVADKAPNIGESISEGVDFVKGFYRDPIIEKHFTDLYGGQSPDTRFVSRTIDPVEVSFRRGATPVSPERLPMFDYKEAQGARGLFDPEVDKTFLSRKFYNPFNQSDPKLAKMAGQTAAHETAHFADKPMFYTEAGAKMEELMSRSLVSDMSDNFFFGPGKEGARALGYRNLDQGAEEYWKYLTEPEEITARTMEMRKLMKETIMNERASGKQFPLFDRIKSDEDLSRLMIGDFSRLSDGELEVLAGEIFMNSDTNSLRHFMEHVIKGGKNFGSKEFREGLSNLFKHALMVPAAGVAATQVEMIDGGKLKLLKKK